MLATCLESLSDETAYKITEQLQENFEAIKQANSALKYLELVNNQLAIPVPLHNGVLQYLNEQSEK